MTSSNGEKAPSKEVKESSLKSFLAKLRKRHIIETLAAFIAGGWLIIEFVHFILIGHYHFPDKTLDVTFITLICVLFCTLIWRWFAGREKPRKFKLELVLIPLVVLITVLVDINLLLHLKGPEAEIVPAAKWKNSIAVLPFVDMSPQKDQEYFCDGMTEELINRLSNIKELKVPARTSAFMFKGKAEDIREIGRKLSVQTVLEGSIRKEGSQLRITVQLINVSDSFHIWSEAFDKELTKVFEIQDEISLAVADKLKVTLLGAEKAKLAKRPTENLEAYSLYLQGRNFWNKRDEKSLTKSIEYFEKAIEIDSNYALAYAGLGDVYSILGNNGFWPPVKAYPKAKAAAARALEIDNSLAEAHTSLAHVREVYDWDWHGAEEEYKQAIELNPRYATAHHWYSLFLVAMGHLNEAVIEAKRAQELDPLSLIVNENVGDVLRLARRYDEAIEQLRKTLDLDPNFAVAHSTLGIAYAENGMYDKSIAEFQKVLPPESALGLKEAYMKSGKNGFGEKWLDLIIDRSKHTYISPFDLARSYAALGRKDEAFSWLDKAYAEHSLLFTYLRADARFDSLRSDPRYTALLKKVGLE